MGKSQNKERRELRRRRKQGTPNDPAPILRLVRSENEQVSSEPPSSGRASETVDTVRHIAGIESGDGEKAGGSSLVAAITVSDLIGLEPGAYEITVPGVPTVDFLRWLYTKTDCLTVLAKLTENIQAYSDLGFVEVFKRGETGFWKLSYDNWLRHTPELKTSGAAFIEQMNSELDRHEKPQNCPQPEKCHLLNLGSCAEMLYGGQPEKAIGLYNSWARFAGYGPILLVSRQPTLLDIGSALVQITDDTFKVILVR